ncbi:hypothetical protein ACWC4C_32675 [Streptomyces olivaceoviridis]
MPVPIPPQSDQHPAPAPAGGLVRSRRLIAAARSRTATLGDGGSTGRSDGND